MTFCIVLYLSISIALLIAKSLSEALPTCCYLLANIGGDLAPSLGGRKRKLADQNLIFLDDLLWGEKILKTFFSHRLYFSDFACLYFCQMFYMLTCMALSS